MCHGAGGMAAHAGFGARSGGAVIILGATSLALALCFGDAIEVLLRALPAALRGAILFLAGGFLARGNLPPPAIGIQALVIAATALAAIWNVAAAFAVGIALHWLAHRRGYPG